MWIHYYIPISFEYFPRIHYLNYPDLLPCWPRNSVGKAPVDQMISNPEVVGSNPTEAKFSLNAPRGKTPVYLQANLLFKWLVINTCFVFHASVIFT